MDINNLKVFCDIAENVSFTETAQKHFISQSAVTKQIRKLEDFYGSTFFYRNSGVTTLTEAGSIFYPYAKELVRLNDLAYDEIQMQNSQKSPVLTVGASFTIGEYSLPNLVIELKKQHPNVQINLKIGNTPTIIKKLEHNEIDIALVESEFDQKNFSVFNFEKDIIVPVCSNKNDLSKLEKVTVNDLYKEQMIVRESGTGMRTAIDNHLNQYEFLEKSKVMELGSIQAIKSAIEADLGISFLPKISIQKELKLDTLKIINVEELNISRDFWCVQKPTRFKKRIVIEFLNLLKQSS